MTTWIPSYEVPPVVPHEEDGVCVTMDELAAIKTGEEVRRSLSGLPKAYGDWIQRQRDADIGDGARFKTRKELMDRADVVRARIVAGIELLVENAQCRRAFCLANQAMATAARRRSPDRYPEGKAPRWRLFQLAFVLLNLQGIADGQHPERRQVELIFFPTGGGKTEAYLGVIAFALVLRRLRRAKSVDGGLGVAVLLRYTLRLLTLDQLGRAATLLLQLPLPTADLSCPPAFEIPLALHAASFGCVPASPRLLEILAFLAVQLPSARPALHLRELGPCEKVFVSAFSRNPPSHRYRNRPLLDASHDPIIVKRCCINPIANPQVLTVRCSQP